MIVDVVPDLVAPTVPQLRPPHLAHWVEDEVVVVAKLNAHSVKTVRLMFEQMVVLAEVPVAEVLKAEVLEAVSRILLMIQVIFVRVVVLGAASENSLSIAAN